MVTYEAKRGGKMIAELEISTYQSIIGEVRKRLPRHVYISPEYVSKEGSKVVRVWCRYPEVAKGAIERALKLKGIRYDFVDRD
ncbi:MAG: hypothetical protein AB1779_08290 [Candidatus Thermoplasmatota archaeon]